MKVVSLHGGPVKGEVNEDVVAALERLLDLAKNADISSLAYATVGNDSNLGTGYLYSMGDRWELMAATRILEARIVEEVLEGGGEG